MQQFLRPGRVVMELRSTVKYKIAKCKGRLFQRVCLVRDILLSSFSLAMKMAQPRDWVCVYSPDRQELQVVFKFLKFALFRGRGIFMVTSKN